MLIFMSLTKDFLVSNGTEGFTSLLYCHLVCPLPAIYSLVNESISEILDELWH